MQTVCSCRIKVEEQSPFAGIEAAPAQSIFVFIVFPVILIETDFPACASAVLSLTYIALYTI